MLGFRGHVNQNPVDVELKVISNHLMLYVVLASYVAGREDLLAALPLFSIIVSIL